MKYASQGFCRGEKIELFKWLLREKVDRYFWTQKQKSNLDLFIYERQGKGVKLCNRRYRISLETMNIPWSSYSSKTQSVNIRSEGWRHARKFILPQRQF